jgi:hypothetical protein
VDKAQHFLSQFSNLRWVGRAAQFEHMEIDDCFGAALQLSREIAGTDKKPAEIKSPHRSALAVEPQLAAVVSASADSGETLACLRSLAASDYAQLRILLVADAADQVLQEKVSAELPEVHILTRPEGMGIPSAFNLGCNHAIRDGADFAFLCLGETAVEPDTLSRMVQVAQRDPEAGILTPKILCHKDPSQIWSIGSQFRKFPPRVKTIGLRQKDDQRFVKSREVEFAVSSGLLVTREVFERVGLFDPGYRFYYEDIDFSRRARHQGFRIRFVPEARMYHKEHRDTKRTPDFYYTWGQSFTRYYRRHMHPLWLTLPVHLLYLALREGLTGNAPHIPALLRGAFNGLHRRMGDIPKLDAEFFDFS